MKRALVNEQVQLSNCILGTTYGCIDLIAVVHALITPEDLAGNMFSGLLKPIHALQHMLGGITQDVHLRGVVPKALRDLCRLGRIPPRFNKVVGKVISAGLQTGEKDFHLPQDDKRKAACSERFGLRSIRDFNASLARGKPVACADCCNGEQSLCPRRPDLWFQTRGADEPRAVKGISHVEFRSVVEAQE